MNSSDQARRDRDTVQRRGSWWCIDSEWPYEKHMAAVVGTLIDPCQKMVFVDLVLSALGKGIDLAGL